MKVDWWLALPALLLALIGLLVLKSIAPDLFINQLLFAAVSLVFFLIFSSLDYQILKSLHLPIFLVLLIFLLSPYFLGIHSRGAKRWLQTGQFTLQPSEIAKPFILNTFSSFAASPVLLIFSLIPSWLIVFFQPDLGTSLVIFSGWAVIFLSRFSLRSSFFFIALVAVLTIPVYLFGLRSYQKDRLRTFINPYHDPLGQGYHVIQSQIAVGSGQFLGRGLGHGTQSQLRFLPERHTDFIFASLSEELGFVGVTSVFVLYSFLFWRIYNVSQRQINPTASVFCLSSLSLLAFQSFINIAMNMGIAPITGITLPFLSSGGSSLLSLGIHLGILNSISQNTPSRV
ncbi:FtsW/RodA/SpoVE family cell cycle protein [Candidatus Amesbacteria bacterium]|nr:FtsW/RodA/SpoVE family cell cycle protein [Candidatus Amesbacteria bacterium]